jgi:hypothetical protein
MNGGVTSIKNIVQSVALNQENVSSLLERIEIFDERSVVANLVYHHLFDEGANAHDS